MRNSKVIFNLLANVDTYDGNFHSIMFSIRAENESNQLDNSSEFDSTINSLNLVHEPNELNLS